MGVTDHIQISFGLVELFILTNFLSKLHPGGRFQIWQSGQTVDRKRMLTVIGNELYVGTLRKKTFISSIRLKVKSSYV